MAKKKEAPKMKARTLAMNPLDANSIFSIWSGNKLTRENVRMAVEVNDLFEAYLAPHQEEIQKLASLRGEDQDNAMEALVEDGEVLTMSDNALQSLKQAIKDHNGWTNRGARQLLRIEEAFSSAEWIDMEPKVVEVPEE